jgi:Rrf2 family protein
VLSLSQTTGYAIQALSCLADECSETAHIQTVSSCSGVPGPYLAKIVRRLNEAGIVASKRGYKGGIWLTRPPEKITLLEISEALDGSDFFSSCLLGSEFCDDDRDCPTHAFWKATRKGVRKELSRTTLADVVAFNRRRARAKARTRSGSGKRAGATAKAGPH